MKKNIVITFFVILILIGIYLFFIIGEIPTVKSHYKEGNERLNNPSRGLYVQIFSNEITRYPIFRQAGYRLILLSYDIHEYRNELIPDYKLKELEDSLLEARDNKMKIIFRAAYGFGDHFEDPDHFEMIETHIKQMAPILNKHRDILLCVQAGFLGPYGEWHNSIYLREDAERNRNKVLEVLLNELDDSIVLNVRRPSFIRSAKDAGLNVERIGYHNDALLSTDTDMGTYVEEGYSRLDELNWVDRNIKTEVNGGEMPLLGEFSTVKNAIYEFDKLHLTYLNSQYNLEVLEHWMSETYEGENAFDYIERRLGYRYSLRMVETPKSIYWFRPYEINGVISNSGFASITPNYHFYLVVYNEYNSYRRRIDIETISKKELRYNVETFLSKDFFDAEENTRLKIGIQLTDNSMNGDNVQFATENGIYENGINILAEYVLQGNKYVLIQ